VCGHSVGKLIADLSVEDGSAAIARDRHQAGALKRQHALPVRQIRADALHARERAPLGPAQHPKQVGDIDHIKVFATVGAAERWFEENDPEGVAFEYDVIE
jgi:hypothetical protein